MKVYSPPMSEQLNLGLLGAPFPDTRRKCEAGGSAPRDPLVNGVWGGAPTGVWGAEQTNLATKRRDQTGGLIES